MITAVDRRPVGPSRSTRSRRKIPDGRPGSAALRASRPRRPPARSDRAVAEAALLDLLSALLLW